MFNFCSLAISNKLHFENVGVKKDCMILVNYVDGIILMGMSHLRSIQRGKFELLIILYNTCNDMLKWDWYNESRSEK
jgi:hypothetical protein